MFDLNPQFTNNPDQKLDQEFIARINQNHANYRHRGGVQFRLETMEEDSGVCSPPLWRSVSPPESRLLSPASRAQAIARGQREMMEMVENMPETSYELSLKDIVEQRRDVCDVSVDDTQSMEEGEERSILGGSQSLKKSKKGSVKRQESNKKGRIVVQNQNKGLLINMFFPFSFGSNQRKSSSIRGRGSSSFGNKSSKPGDGGDRSDWWWKKFTGSNDSSSSTSGETTGRSGSSGSSGSSTSGGSVRINSVRKSKGCGQGCWFFFASRKRKT